MKTLYLECNMGAAGDMLSAALFELLQDKEDFIRTMNHIGLEGVVFEPEKSVKCGITGTHMSVRIHGEEETAGHDHYHDHDHHHDEHDHDHDHEHDDHHHDEHGHNHDERDHHHDDYDHEHDDHHHDEHAHDHGEHHHHDEHRHHHASLEHIHHVIEHLDLPEQVKKDACAVYDKIAQAESHAHDKPVDQIHFHEVGTMDAVADVVCCCYLIYLLKAERIIASPINVGYGQVHCAHGILPVPAPATAFLLKDIPTYAGSIEGEMCTPSGAALLAHFASAYQEQPVMRVQAVGYGMGSKDFSQANCVRAFLGETAEEASGGPNGVIVELSCNIDDMTGEQLGYAAESIRQQGALEVFICPVQMKKNRSGQLLVCLCKEEEADRFAQMILRETSTLGVRRKLCERYTLNRSFEKADTKYGTITVKRGEGYGVVKKKAEYEDLAAAAKKHGVSIEEVQQAVQRVVEK